MKQGMFRFKVLVATLAIAVGGLVYGQGEMQGTELTILIHPTLYAASGGDGGIIAEFEQATGATVRVVTAPIPEHSERAMLEFLAGTGRFDVIAMQNSDFTSNFLPYFLPLNDYIARDGTEWGWDDVIPGLAQTATSNGQQLGIPYRWGSSIMYYRTDLLEAAGVAVPTNFDELRAAAAALTQDTDGDGQTDVYGFVLRGQAPSELAHDWLHTFYANGGTFFDEAGQCGLDTEAGAAATMLWADFFNEGIFPPDIFAWGRDDYIAAMQQGRAAMGIYIDSYYQRFFGEDSTLERDQVGWALAPTAPGVPDGRTRGGGWHLVISQDSKNPDAAWELVKVLTSAESQLRMATQYGNGPIRSSTYESPEFQELWPQADVILVATANQAQDPAHPAQPVILDLITSNVTDVMRGRVTVEEGLSRLCMQVNSELANY